MSFMTVREVFLGKWLLFAFIPSLSADALVDFSNRTPTDPAKLVRMYRFDPVSWEYSEVPVANGLEESETCVAQLFVLRAGLEEPVGAAANFRTATSPARGSWVGGIRTVAGAVPGETLRLRVKAWDARSPTPEAADLCNLLHGASAAFDYTPPAEITSPDQLQMAGFTGFTLGRRRYSPHAAVVVDENGSATIGPPDLFHPNGNAAMTTEEWHGLLRAAEWGTFGAVIDRGERLEFHAPSDRYGEMIVNGRQCDDCGHCASVPLVKVSIRPTPRRPYLAFVARGGTHDLVLRGLAGRNYRVEHSSDLKVWNQYFGAFSGDWNEVLIEASAVKSSAGWYRFLDANQ